MEAAVAIAPRENSEPELIIISCPVCASIEEGLVVGRKGRFGASVENVVCPTCALVYQRRRPSAQATATYYEEEYRREYETVGYVDRQGHEVHFGTAEFQAALGGWHSAQAERILRYCPLPDGARVLEVGCRDGRTLLEMARRKHLVTLGIEPGKAAAAQAQAAGIDCFVGTVEEYTAEAHSLDLVQMLHVLEHLHDPLSVLVSLREWLKPDARVYVEVPNLYEPYGGLEENFFQSAHLLNFSRVTLVELFRRAGFQMEWICDAEVLIGVFSKTAADAPVPRPFDPQHLSHPEEDAAWVFDRLRTYRDLEELRKHLLHGSFSDAHLPKLARTLMRPAFLPHLSRCLAEFCEVFLKSGQPERATYLLEATERGDHPLELRERIRALRLQSSALA